MANTNVNVIMTAQEARMADAWLRARRSVGQFEDGLRKAGATGQQSGRKIAGGVDAVIPSLSRAAMTFMGVATAVQAVANAARMIRAESEWFDQRQKEAAGHQIEVGPLKAATAESFTAQPGYGLDEMFKDASEFSTKKGIPETVLFPALKAVFAAVEDDRKALEAIGTAYDITTSQRGAANALLLGTAAKNAIALSERTGMSLEEAAAFNRQSFRASYVTDESDFANYIVPTMSQLLAMNTSQEIDPATGKRKEDRPEFLAALMAALTQTAKEKQGQITSTNIPIVFNNLQKMLSAVNEGLGTVEEKMLKIVNDPELHDAFLGAAGIGSELAESLGDIEELRARAAAAPPGVAGGAARLALAMAEAFTKGSETRRLMESYEKQIGPAGPKQVAIVKAEAETIRKASSTEVSQLAQRGETSKQALEALDSGALRSTIFENTNTDLFKSGQTSIGMTMDRIEARLTYAAERLINGPDANDAELLKDQIERLAGARKRLEAGPQSFWGGQKRAPSDVEIQRAVILKQQEDTLRESLLRRGWVEQDTSVRGEDGRFRSQSKWRQVPVEESSMGGVGGKLDQLIDLQTQALTNPTPVTVANPKDLLQKNAPRASAAGNLRDPQPAAF